MSDKKERKGVEKKNVIDTPCESNISTVIEKRSHQEITTHSGIFVNLQ